MKPIKSLLFILCLSFSISAEAKPTYCSDYKEFVNHQSEEVIAILEDKSLSDDQIESKLVTLADKLINFKWMAKFVMGRNWSGLTDEQKEAYVESYQQYLIHSYVPRFKEYKGQTLKITNSTPLKREGEQLVYTTLSSDGGKDIKVTYRLKKDSKCFRITDIIGEGVSLINTQRQDFSAVFKRKGFDGLLELLNSKS